MALVTAPPFDGKLTTVPYAETDFCAVLPEAHQAAHNEQASLRDLSSDEWILFARSVNAAIYDGITETAASQGIPTRQAHEVMTAQEAFYLVSEGAGVAVLPKPSVIEVRASGVVVVPLFDPSLSFETSLIMRRDDDSKLVNEFARSFLPKAVSIVLGFLAVATTVSPASNAAFVSSMPKPLDEPVMNQTLRGIFISPYSQRLGFDVGYEPQVAQFGAVVRQNYDRFPCSPGRTNNGSI